MRRPDVFTLDYSHPLTNGLRFAGLCSLCGSTKYHDASLYRNDGVLSGFVSPQQRQGAPEIGRSYIEFDGSNDKITTGLVYTYDSRFAITFAGWVRINPSAAKGQTLLSYGPYAPAFIAARSASPYKVSAYFGGAFRDFDSTLPADTWAHIAMTRGADNVLRAYVNGKQESTTHSVSTVVSGGVGVGLTIGNDTGGGWLQGGIADPMYWGRALSPAEIALLADRTDPMLGGLIVEEQPVLYFDMGGSTTHGLTASDLVTGSPVLGTPALGQVHALTATGITTSSPVLGTPALGQVHVLNATGLTVSAPVLGTPAVGQVHSLTASALVAGSPVLGTPTLTENAPDIDSLAAADLVVGSPVLGTPALGQAHVLGTDGLVTGPPVLGSPSITQIHTLEALGLTVGVPVLGTPVLNGVITDLQVRAELNTIGSNQHAAQSFGTFNAEFQSFGTTRIELICIANFEVNELGG